MVSYDCRNILHLFLMMLESSKVVAVMVSMIDSQCNTGRACINIQQLLLSFYFV